MRTEPTTAELIDLVVTIPGVSRIEPGLGTRQRALDARIRRAGSGTNHFGLLVDRVDNTVTVEVCLDRSRPVRDSVRDIQLVLRDALGDTVPTGTELQVRVQSLDGG